LSLAFKEELYGKPVVSADRDTVEADANVILDEAANGKVAFLVVGDVFGLAD
jgi:diphthamide biosynthesis methyltransferase